MGVWKRNLSSGLLLRVREIEIEWYILRRVWSSLQVLQDTIRMWKASCVNLEALTSTTFLVQILFRLSSDIKSQGPPFCTDQPSKTLSTALLLPSPPPLTSTSTTNSAFSPPPGPSPPGPNTSLSLSYTRSLMGMKTPQNFSGVEEGGGGVKYAVDKCVRRMGGCDIIWVMDGENEV